MHTILRIGISGPESSGKTVLAKALSRHFGEPYVPEFARLYLGAHGSDYSEADIQLMEQGQLLWEQEAASLARKVIFCDTDYLVFRIWKKFKALDDSRSYLYPCTLHLICKPDIPWTYDPLREHPTMREELFSHYLNLAGKLNLNHAIAEGDFNQRFLLAVKKVTECLEAQH